MGIDGALSGGGRSLGLLLVALMVIALIDYGMGAAAQTLNGYEIVRRTVAEPMALGWPVVSETYIIGQPFFGRWALAWGWLLYLAWGAFWALLLRLLLDRLIRPRGQSRRTDCGRSPRDGRRDP